MGVEETSGDELTCEAREELVVLEEKIGDCWEEGWSETKEGFIGESEERIEVEETGSGGEEEDKAAQGTYWETAEASEIGTCTVEGGEETCGIEVVGKVWIGRETTALENIRFEGGGTCGEKAGIEATDSEEEDKVAEGKFSEGSEELQTETCAAE